MIESLFIFGYKYDFNEQGLDGKFKKNFIQ